MEHTDGKRESGSVWRGLSHDKSLWESKMEHDPLILIRLEVRAGDWKSKSLHRKDYLRNGINQFCFFCSLTFEEIPCPARRGQQLNHRSKQSPPLLQGRKIFGRWEALLSDSLSWQDFAPWFDAGAMEENFSSAGELLSMWARDAQRRWEAFILETRGSGTSLLKTQGCSRELNCLHFLC